jgi:hypothetical protein
MSRPDFSALRSGTPLAQHTAESAAAYPRPAHKSFGRAATHNAAESVAAYSPKDLSRSHGSRINRSKSGSQKCSVEWGSTNTPLRAKRSGGFSIVMASLLDRGYIHRLISPR